MISVFMRYTRILVLMGLCSSASVLASLQPYDHEIFTGNPDAQGKGFYFLTDKVSGTKTYPHSCEEFYQLWSIRKYPLDVDVYDNDNTYYRYNLGGCLLSKWINFQQINRNDNIIDKEDIKKITSILPAGISAYISPEQCKKIVISEMQNKTLKSISPDLKVTKKINNEVEFKNSGGDDFSIEFYGSVQDKTLGKVYPINTSYSVRSGTGGTYNTSSTYLLSKNGTGAFHIVYRFPALEPCY